MSASQDEDEEDENEEDTEDVRDEVRLDISHGPFEQSVGPVRSITPPVPDT